jgi:hypothetical protein
VAKVYGHFITVNYRESYDLFLPAQGYFSTTSACQAIRRSWCESEACRRSEPPHDLVPLRRKGRSAQSFDVEGMEIWDGEEWTGVKAITATRRRTSDPEHRMLSVEARGGWWT